MPGALTTRPIPRIEAPDPEVFLREYVRRSQPVVIGGAIDDWPALERWTPRGLLEAFGDRPLPSIPVRDGNAVFDPKRGIDYAPIGLADFVRDLEAGTAQRYVIFRVHEHLPELMGDIRTPRYLERARWRRSRFWFSPGNVGSVLHRDLPENLYAQVAGHKRWMLVSRRELTRVYPHPPWSGVPNYCRASVEDPDLARFPRLRGLTVHTTTLGPGELLYIPSLWWHQARSVDTSISINLWWVRGALLPLVRAAEAFMAVRRLRL
ncbi:cupin-like domain-containing protein [Paraliomyxa miuraensis]|uniref:cupin-like domain-containing protein n=1 Tax=Paraliomyxa miuraensis TaxID=376150 RepID=UPI0022578BF2|nr:cupin-like domain-containing protein [Paraliomyxa miuraensis]MCX4243644.1 cupin-like domain-containing protein [Paraliomyxa miuraensis]